MGCLENKELGVNLWHTMITEGYKVMNVIVPKDIQLVIKEEFEDGIHTDRDLAVGRELRNCPEKGAYPWPLIECHSLLPLGSFILNLVL